jgi:hypothetical protein
MNFIYNGVNNKIIEVGGPGERFDIEISDDTEVCSYLITI